jgi:hypothetical protein
MMVEVLTHMTALDVREFGGVMPDIIPWLFLGPVAFQVKLHWAIFVTEKACSIYYAAWLADGWLHLWAGIYRVQAGWRKTCPSGRRLLPLHPTVLAPLQRSLTIDRHIYLAGGSPTNGCA